MMMVASRQAACRAAPGDSCGEQMGGLASGGGVGGSGGSSLGPDESMSSGKSSASFQQGKVTRADIYFLGDKIFIMAK